MSNIKFKLEYGNPAISRAEETEERFYLEVLIPGVADGEMFCLWDEGKLMVEHEVDSRFIEKFKFFIYAIDVDFLRTETEKQNGILYISAPKHQNRKEGSKSVTV